MPIEPATTPAALVKNPRREFTLESEDFYGQQNEEDHELCEIADRHRVIGDTDPMHARTDTSSLHGHGRPSGRWT
jgi:hypothetical protein